MQLKLKRSQRDGGVLSKTVVFCLDARVDFSQPEAESIRRYKLHNEVIYNSEAQQQLLDRGDAHLSSGTMGGSARAMATFLMARTKLYVTVSDLQKGKHIECKSLDELLGAEGALMTACENLRDYLAAAATFDGREVVVDFAADGGQTVVAHAVSPQPALAISPTASAPRATPMPSLEPPPAPSTEPDEYASFSTMPDPVADWVRATWRDHKVLVIGGGIGAFVLLKLFGFF